MGLINNDDVPVRLFEVKALFDVLLERIHGDNRPIKVVERVVIDRNPAHPVLLDFVADDLGSSASTGRCGLTAESALRCALLKQYRQLSYEKLAFHLLDSASFGAFARLPVDWTPRKAALQMNITAIPDTTWHAINTQLLGTAGQAGVERATL